MLPPSLSALSRTQLWAPLVFSESEKSTRGSHSFQAIGRLKYGVTIEQAAEQMSAIAARIERQYPDGQTGRGVRLMKYEERIMGGLVRKILLVLLGAVGFVLLIACTNVANLLLARAAGRHREIAVRMALGAQRADIYRLVVGKGLVLTVVGLVLGLAASFGLTRFLESLLFEVKPDDPLTSAGVALLLLAVALLACLIPARRATKVDPMVALRYE